MSRFIPFVRHDSFLIFIELSVLIDTFPVRCRILEITMLKKLIFASAIALVCSAAFASGASAQEQTQLATELAVQSTVQSADTQIAQRDPRSPERRRDVLEDDDLETLNDADVASNPVTVSLRLNTELFANSGDLVEFLVPVRYNPSDRLALEAVPVLKYFPESTADEFDYGIKFAVEYRL